MLQLLHQTRIAAQATAQKYASYASSTRDSSSLPTVLILNTPTTLTPHLISLGIDEPSSAILSSALERAATRLKAIFMSDFSQRCKSLEERGHYFQTPKHASLLSSAYSTIYYKAIRDWSSYILTDFAPRFVKALLVYQRAISLDQPSRSRRTFNQSAVPILEQFFGLNAFPSRMEKLELASRCEMEYKQIHVWFQNRRSRSRKEGNDLRRPVGNSLLSRELEMAVDVLLSSNEDEEGDDVASHEEDKCFIYAECQDITFHYDPPAHVFPTPYPPQCSYDPFPICEGKRSFPLPWIRIKTSSSSSLTPTVNVGELTYALSKLTISDELEESRWTPPHRKQSRATGLQLGFVTLTSRAPLPALVASHRRPMRRLHRASSCSPTPQSRGRTTLPDRRALIRLEAPLQAQTKSYVSPSSEPESYSGKRGLPRRVPQHPPILHPPQEEAPAPLHGLPKISRASSVSSTSSSSGSDNVSPLSTPPLPPSYPVQIVPLLPLDKSVHARSEYLSELPVDIESSAPSIALPAKVDLDFLLVSVGQLAASNP